MVETKPFSFIQYDAEDTDSGDCSCVCKSCSLSPSVIFDAVFNMNIMLKIEVPPIIRINATRIVRLFIIPLLLLQIFMLKFFRSSSNSVFRRQQVEGLPVEETCTKIIHHFSDALLVGELVVWAIRKAFVKFARISFAVMLQKHKASKGWRWKYSTNKRRLAANS